MSEFELRHVLSQCIASQKDITTLITIGNNTVRQLCVEFLKLQERVKNLEERECVVFTNLN